MANYVNEKMKKRYFKWLINAKGLSEETIVTIERAIHLFEESTNYKDFKTFSERQAIAFKKWLSEKKNKNNINNKLSNATKYNHLRLLNNFFAWLASQPGYKSRISLDSVSYLSLDLRAVREALSRRPCKYPSLEQVKTLVNSIKIEDDIDRRDQALIAFMLITGMRYQAICSVSIECIDSDKMIVFQDPRLGVHTKGGKIITTRILPFDNLLVNIFKEWVKYLTTILKFGPTDPLFPMTNITQAEDGYSFEAKDLKAEFWSKGSSIRKILKKRSEKVGLPYFNPHSFRHAACQLALKLSPTPEELKALSQNFGHESITTTLRNYGTLDDDRVDDVISKMDFSGKRSKIKSGITFQDLEDFVKANKA